MTRLKQCDLTLFGKIQIIISFVLSKLTKTATVLCIPKGLVKEINKLMFSFIWGTKDTVSRSQIVQSIEIEGSRMPFSGNKGHLGE